HPPGEVNALRAVPVPDANALKPGPHRLPGPHLGLRDLVQARVPKEAHDHRHVTLDRQTQEGGQATVSADVVLAEQHALPRRRGPQGLAPHPPVLPPGHGRTRALDDRHADALRRQGRQGPLALLPPLPAGDHHARREAHPCRARRTSAFRVAPRRSMPFSAAYARNSASVKLARSTLTTGTGGGGGSSPHSTLNCERRSNHARLGWSRGTLATPTRAPPTTCSVKVTPWN